MIGLWIVLAHLTGDYLIQSHWMATEKVKRMWPAVAHGVTYTLPWLVVTHSWWALVVVGGTHIVIDRWRLARYVVWAKNLMAPASHRSPLTATGYPDSTPIWLSTWLLIIADNTMHLVIGAVVIMAAS